MGGTAAQTGNWVGMDLISPAIDFVTLARSMGVDATLVEQASEIGDVVQTAMRSGKPYLVEVPIAAQ
jgi:benzoylformate decarboxylase